MVPDKPPERKPNAPNYLISLIGATASVARLVLDLVKFYCT